MAIEKDKAKANGAANGSKAESSAATAKGEDSLTKTSPDADMKEETSADDQPAAVSQDEMFYLTVRLPHDPHKITILASKNEEVQDVRQSILEFSETLQYSCFHLEHRGKRINDFLELGDIEGFAGQDEKDKERELTLVEDPYTEREARIHLVRIRDYLGATTDQYDAVRGITNGVSVHSTVVSGLTDGDDSEAKPVDPELLSYTYDEAASFQTLLAKSKGTPPKVVKALSLSPWHPPPYHLRQRGHLLYLQVTTNENEQFHATSHVSGFYVNKSTNAKFDPTPRASPKSFASHSLLSLLSDISSSFKESFDSLQQFNKEEDPIAILPITNALPANPWVVPSPAAPECNHVYDVARPQEKTLQYGIDSMDTMRDWNEEFQSTRELPKETVSERCLRDRLMQKLFAEYNEAAAKGAMLVAKGEVTPLNPTENHDAQIYLYNNIFYSFGCDGLGTFATQGGDEAARVATGKDVTGVRTINNLDIPGLAAPGTVVVDYLGRRIVAQSIVPGIFKQREPGEAQIDYGGIDGREVIAENPVFAPLFEKLAKAMHTKKHAVWDKAGGKHELETSVETKGLLGADGRKYVLDLYRTTPLDVEWLKESWTDENPKEDAYPHRMAVLRPELVESFWAKHKNAFILQELDKRIKEIKAKEEEKKANGGDDKEIDAEEKAKEELADRIQWDDTKFTLNPDVYSGDLPTESSDREMLEKDTKDVEAACKYLTEEIIPGFLNRINKGDINVPMDGPYLSWAMHKQGINVRYLGKIATLIDEGEPRLQALKVVATQEMVTRAFKHVLNAQLRDTPTYYAANCISHLLNCLLGTELDASPEAVLDESLQVFGDEKPSFTSVTPASLKADIEAQVQRRFRYELPRGWMASLKHLQVLREASLKIGIQLEAKEYHFAKGEINGTESGQETNGASKKKKKGETKSSTKKSTFQPEDILNIFPVTKDATPKSSFAAEVLDAARGSIGQSPKELTLELMMEALSIHENIYGALHPEMARVYTDLSMIYYHLEDKVAARELGRKAAIVSERMFGVDSAETIHTYMNLGLFEHADGHSDKGLACLKHGLSLWKIAYGADHPDLVLPLTNIGVMLLGLKSYAEAVKWYEAALALTEASKSSPANAAAILFQLAQVLAMSQDSKGAVKRMREAYNLYLSDLGPDNKNTKEAESWLEQLTQNAVSIAKHAKSLQDRGLRRVHFAKPVAMLGKSQAPTGSASSKAAAPGASAGGVTTAVPSGVPSSQQNRSIDELLKYIEGGDKPSKKRRNGKTRKATAGKA